MRVTNGRKTFLGILSLVVLTAFRPLSVSPQEAEELPAYLLLDGFGVVRLIEETNQGQPMIYDVASFGADKSSYTDMEVGADDIYLLSIWGYIRSLKDPDWYCKVGMDLDIAMDLEMSPNSPGFYVLDKYGAVYAVEGATSEWGQIPPYFGWDIARDFEITPDGKGYYLLDGYGVIHTVGQAPALKGVYFGWDIARDIELLPDGSGCCLMDGFGDVYLITEGEPLKLTQAPNLGWDIAKDLTLAEGHASFCVLDGFGTIHQWGNAPALSGFPLRWNVAQNMEMLSRQRAQELIKPPLPTDIQMTPNKQTSAVWQDAIPVHLRIDNVMNLEEFEFIVLYDSNVLTPADGTPARPGELLEGFGDETKFVTEEETNGLLKVKSLYFGQEDKPAITGSGILMTLLFNPVQAGTSEIAVREFKGTDSRTLGSAWRLEDPKPVLIEVVSREASARIQVRPKVIDIDKDMAGIQEPIIAEVFLLDASNAHGVSFDVEFDSSALRLKSVREGDLLQAFGTTVPLFSQVDEANETGTLYGQGVTLLGRLAAAKGSGAIAELRFVPKKGVSGTVRLRNFEIMTLSRRSLKVPIANPAIEIPPN